MNMHNYLALWIFVIVGLYISDLRKIAGIGATNAGTRHLGPNKDIPTKQPSNKNYEERVEKSPYRAFNLGDSIGPGSA